MLPLILTPTTSGTGSEMTSICVLSDTKNNVKKGIVSEHMFARVALLDPQLTMGMPPRVTAMTGMDALVVHPVLVGVRASVFTDTLNLQAIRLVAANLRLAYANGDNRAARRTCSTPPAWPAWPSRTPRTTRPRHGSRHRAGRISPAAQPGAPSSCHR